MSCRRDAHYMEKNKHFCRCAEECFSKSVSAHLNIPIIEEEEEEGEVYNAWDGKEKHILPEAI